MQSAKKAACKAIHTAKKVEHKGINNSQCGKSYIQSNE